METSRCTAILDIDETILNPLYRYRDQINEAMGMSLSVREIERSGGLDNYFRNSPRYLEFHGIAQRLRSDEEFNSDLPAIEGAVDGVSRLGQIEGLCLGCYLTTRPAQVARVTAIDLERKGFPSMPIICRPSDVQRSDTLSWKLSTIEELAADYHGVLVSIDDSLALATAIRNRNHNSSNFIVAILFNGPLTYFAVRQGGIHSSKGEHFYVADWKKIPFVCSDYARIVSPTRLRKI
jgi:hypothetical protein